MKSAVVVLCLCLSTAWALPSLQESGVRAEPCPNDQCRPENNCRCSNATSPILTLDDYPQLIALTFDDAVTDSLFTNNWEPLLFSRINPDNNAIGATFFVPHEYTDYERVNDLFNYGFEIGVHSITRNNLQQYWRTASEELLEQEFGGQMDIISKFANIPKENILGARTPQLQLAGNYSFQAYIKAGLKYDSSWPTVSPKPLFPYTLDYLSDQDCNLGNACPNEAFPGFWILPINDLQGLAGDCNNLASCNITGSAEEIGTWLMDEVNRIRTTTKAPITLIVNSYWFDFTENSFEGLEIFLDKLEAYKDTFLVAQSQVLEFMKNPVPLSDFQTDVSENFANCNPVSCRLIKDAPDDYRYMKSCVPCPAAYPWLGNPAGNPTV